MSVDGHGGDVAGGGYFGHGELPGVVHPLSLADQRRRHLRFAPTGTAPAPSGDQAGLGPLFDERSFVYLDTP
jgi:hypothetical protein